MQYNRAQLRQKIEEDRLITGYIDLDRQLTPNGFDMTLAQIEAINDRGSIDFTNEERDIPPSEPVDLQDEWWELEKGVYKATANEVVDIPADLVGIGFPRSSLMRMGAHIQNAFWEAGYHGKTQFLLCVENPAGIRIKKDARVLQLSFHELEEVSEGYSGRYGFTDS